jgi:preprotein translocase subunit SecF
MLLVPNFKGLDLFPHGTRIGFMRWKSICFWTSVAMMIASVALVSVRGFNFGVDFKGGTMIVLQAKQGNADIPALRRQMDGLGLGDVQIQEFGKPSEVLVRVAQQPGGDEAQQKALVAVETATAAAYKPILKEVVGPAVSSELRRTGIIAVICSLLAIIAYVWFRFEWQFAAGTIVALTHDVLLTAGLFSLLWLEFDLSIVAALLTILGYSVNDTVVISDRIRENLRKYKRMDLIELLDLSINETLSRTFLTGITTLVVLLALFFLGGPVIHNFVLAMLVGIVIGTYSSIFIAAPLLAYLGVKRDWSTEQVLTPVAAKR